MVNSEVRVDIPDIVSEHDSRRLLPEPHGAEEGASHAENGGGKARAQKRGVCKDEDNIVVAENVHKTYLLGIEGVAALRGVSLKIKRGELVMLFGTSGGGKSTLLNIIGTIDKPTKGNIFVCGTRICDKTPDSELASIRLNKLGFVFQTFNLMSQLSALENVELPLALQGSLSPADRRARSIHLLNSVGMGGRLHHVPSELSGGEQQRVTIARALVNWPDILLLDEPTGDLDTKSTDTVMRILIDLNRKHGITMVIVTHDVLLRSYADRIIHLRDGKIAREEVMDVSAKEKAVKDLFDAQGAQVGSTGLREGATSEGSPASNATNSVFTDRGLSPSKCSMTCVRQPEDYATYEAHVEQAEADDDDEAAMSVRKRLAFRGTNSFY